MSICGIVATNLLIDDVQKLFCSTNKHTITKVIYHVLSYNMQMYNESLQIYINIIIKRNEEFYISDDEKIKSYKIFQLDKYNHLTTMNLFYFQHLFQSIPTRIASRNKHQNMKSHQRMKLSNPK